MLIDARGYKDYRNFLIEEYNCLLPLSCNRVRKSTSIHESCKCTFRRALTPSSISVAGSAVCVLAFQREYTRMRCLLTQYAESRICVTMEYVAPRRYESLILHARFRIALGQHARTVAESRIQRVLSRKLFRSI